MDSSILIPLLVSAALAVAAKIIDSYLERRKLARPDAMSEVSKLWERLDTVEKNHAAEVKQLREGHEKEMDALRAINASLIARLTHAEQEVIRLKNRITELENGDYIPPENYEPKKDTI